MERRKIRGDLRLISELYSSAGLANEYPGRPSQRSETRLFAG
jgi:hypothetical protein